MGEVERLMSLSGQFADTPAGRVLKAIQVRGKASIKDVAADLGVTASAVRLQLAQLQASGAIRTDKVREGVGRPYYVYSLTPQAYGLLYRETGDLARMLLEEVSETQGQDALRALLGGLGKRLADKYRDQVPGRDLPDRVRAWADLLDRRGLAVEIEETGEGYVLREYGCPYHNLAVENRAVCEMERQVVARLLGSGVKLTKCVLDGHRGCEFTIFDGT